MKKLWFATMFLMLCLASNVYSQPVNFGFETGDTSGWTEDIPQQQTGAIEVVTSWTGPTDEEFARPDIVTYTPVEGNYFAVLRTASDTEFTTLSQRFSLKGGDTLEGSASYCCGEEVYFPYFANDADNYNDYALISVLNAQGAVVAVPWYADAFDIGYEITTPEGERTGESVNFGPLPWEHWNWTASAPGSYTLKYQIAHVADISVNSWAFFDGPNGQSTAVPEASTMALLGISFAGIMAARIFRKSHRTRQGWHDSCADVMPFF